MARLTRKPNRDSAVLNSEPASAATHVGLTQSDTALSSDKAHGLRRVLIDGHVLGLECQSLVLWEFVAAGFAECYLETRSGALYALFRQGKELVMAQALGHDQPVRTATVPEDVIMWAELKVGEPFNYGSGLAPALMRITIVTDTTFLEDEPTPENALLVARERTDGHLSDVRHRFRTLVTRGA